MHSKTQKETDQPKFSLGNVVATPGAIQALEQYNVTASELLDRHCHGDWGQLEPDDFQANEAALQQGSRLLSNYPLTDACRIWIITEWDRSVTTLLLPEEY